MSDSEQELETSEQRFGTYLRRERELRQIGLPYIADYTRIGQDRLQALEDGDWDDFGASVYLRGAVANYARAIGLDVDDTLIRLESEAAEHFDVGNGRVASKDNPLFQDAIEKPPGPNFLLILFVFLAVGAGVVMAWYAFKQELNRDFFTQDKDLPAVTTSAVTVAATQPTTTPTAVTNTATITEATPTVTPKTEQKSEVDAGQTQVNNKQEAEVRHRLVLNATEECWLQYSRDGEALKEAILKPDQTLQLSGISSIYVRTGNAGGVTLTLDGKNLGTLGAPGAVREKTFEFNQSE